MLNLIKSNKADKFWVVEWFENNRGGSIFHPTEPLAVFSFDSFQLEISEFVRKHFEACRYRRIDLKTNVLPDKKELRRALENDIAAQMEAPEKGVTYCRESITRGQICSPWNGSSLGSI